MQSRHVIETVQPEAAPASIRGCMVVGKGIVFLDGRIGDSFAAAAGGVRRPTSAASTGGHTKQRVFRSVLPG